MKEFYLQRLARAKPAADSASRARATPSDHPKHQETTGTAGHPIKDHVSAAPYISGPQSSGSSMAPAQKQPGHLGHGSGSSASPSRAAAVASAAASNANASLLDLASMRTSASVSSPRAISSLLGSAAAQGRSSPLSPLSPSSLHPRNSQLPSVTSAVHSDPEMKMER